MSILLSIFLGGGLGALLRFLISEQTNRLFLSSVMSNYGNIKRKILILTIITNFLTHNFIQAYISLENILAIEFTENSTVI